jgi:hypothetical protein
MPACDEDAEHTIGRAATRRPTLDHNMVCVVGEILKSRPFYAHEIGAKRCRRCSAIVTLASLGLAPPELAPRSVLYRAVDCFVPSGCDQNYDG